MKKTTRLLTCGFRMNLTRYAKLVVKQGARKRHREPSRALAGWLATGGAICLFAALAIPTDSQASNYKRVITSPKLQVIDYQIYTLKKLRSIRQFNCAVTLWNRESNWRPKASNQGHYGIVQGRSDYLRTATPYEQIDWGIRYIRSRYGVDDSNNTNVCLALGHSYRKFWY